MSRRASNNRDELSRAARTRFVGVLYLVLVAVALRGLIVRNVTNSEPLGYYLLLPAIQLRYGDLVALCEPQPAHAFAAAHHFSAVRHDFPIDGCPESRVLIKAVWGLPGDSMRVTDAGVSRNGMLLHHSVLLPNLPDGTPLPTPPPAIVPPGEAWGGSQAAKSFDSRYFGPARTLARARWIPAWIVDVTILAVLALGGALLRTPVEGTPPQST